MKGQNLLKSLRKNIKLSGFDAFLLFHQDSHRSEYLAPCDEKIAFISGFTGSNGLCLITHNEEELKQKALMWTDGRYYLQASKQLYDGWEMMKMEPGEIQFSEWIKENLPSGSKVAVDESQIEAATFESKKELFEKSGIQLEHAGKNFVDEIWEDRPLKPQKQIWILEDKYSGQTSQEKYDKISEQMGEAQLHLITTLDDIAWTLNLRGDDIDFNPLFFSYLIFHKKTDKEPNRCELFIDQQKINAQVHEYLEKINVSVFPYEQVQQHLELISKSKQSILIDKNVCNYQLYLTLKNNGFKIEQKTNIIQHLKAMKNKVQQEGMRQANIRDCAAIMKYFAFLEEELKNKDHQLNEFNGARKVENYRTFGQNYVGPSFDTISSIGPNGAVIHYKPKEDSALKLNNDEIYLLDSGGQYLEGTTDITRTAHFGGKEPTPFQKQAYTRVLLGVLDLEKVVWPSKSNYCGADFDILARKHLFEIGLNYKHGTGHGVGSLLCVHEGPIGVSKRSMVQLEEGMCVSDEPGYYQDGEFGIRIENVIMVQQHPKYQDHLYFENLTVAPYCRELIETEILSDEMIKYINSHHQKCLQKLTPLLQEDERALKYVQRQCAPLVK